jgi:hypothetical protein
MERKLGGRGDRNSEKPERDGEVWLLDDSVKLEALNEGENELVINLGNETLIGEWCRLGCYAGWFLLEPTLGRNLVPP